jgi:predicted ATPase
MPTSGTKKKKYRRVVMPELDTIAVKGFKSISSLETLKLAPINVLIGPNGSGKSNFIGVFSFLHALREGHLQAYVAESGGANKILHFGVKTTQNLEIRISFQGGVNEYEIVLSPTQNDQLYPSTERVYFWDKSKYQRPHITSLSRKNGEAGISDPNSRRTAAYVRQHLDRWRLYHFHDTSSSSPMKRTADINDNRYLRPDASNLAAFLYLLRAKHPAAYTLIRGAIRRVAPFFDDFVLEPQELNPSKIQIEWRHKGSEDYFDASSLSDGTLRFMALATLFLQPEELRPSVILVDEPELGLHPYAITMLASLIKQSSRTTQAIISTQSAHLLDHFQPEDVLVADRVDGGTRLTRLDRSKLATWLQDYSLGQLWEKNEIGGRPAAE